MLPLSFCDTTLVYRRHAISLNFFHPHLTLAATASCTPPLELRTSPTYENFTTIYITSLSSVTFSLCQVKLVKPKHSLLTKSTTLVKLFFLSHATFMNLTVTLNTLNGVSSGSSSAYQAWKLESFNYCILSPMQKAFDFFHIYFGIYSLARFFIIRESVSHCGYITTEN